MTIRGLPVGFCLEAAAGLVEQELALGEPPRWSAWVSKCRALGQSRQVLLCAIVRSRSFHVHGRGGESLPDPSVIDEQRLVRGEPPGARVVRQRGGGAGGDRDSQGEGAGLSVGLTRGMRAPFHEDNEDNGDS